MIIERCPWVKNTELINEIMQLNSKLSTHDLQLDFSTSPDDEYVTDIVISSNLDETIIVKFSMFENISRRAFNNNMTNKLRILSEKVEFIKFVIDSILKMKEYGKFLSIHSLRIKFDYEPMFYMYSNLDGCKSDVVQSVFKDVFYMYSNLQRCKSKKK